MAREKAVIISMLLIAAMAMALMLCLLGVFWGLEPSPAGTGGDPGGAGRPASGPGGPGEIARTDGNGLPAGSASAAGGVPETELSLTTTPAGATVLLDGRLIGVSPVHAVRVAGGAHSLRLEKEGYEPKVLALSLQESSAVLQESLTEIAFAELTVVSTPVGAEVTLDGEFRGRTPLTLRRIRPGPHELRVSKANYTAYQALQVLRPGEKLVVNDLKLENQLLLMLEAMLEQDRRSIGTWMELAHFHFIQNEMDLAARYFTRARELAAQPSAQPLAEMTEGEREALRNEAQWNRSKLIGEIRKHLEQGRTYYGSELNHEQFKSEYTQQDREFQRWQNGWRDLAWVQNEAFARSLKGDWERMATLFEDYTVGVDSESGAAWGGLVRAELLLGRLANAEAHFQKAQTLLSQPAEGIETRYREITWLDLAKAYGTAAWRTPSAARKNLLDRMDACLKGLAAVATPSALTKLEATRAQGQYYRLSNQRQKRVTFLQSAEAQAAAAFAALPDNAKDRRFVREEWERLQLQLAWAELAAGDNDGARRRAETLRGKDILAGDVTLELQGLLDSFNRGERPVEPPYEPVVAKILPLKP